MDGFHDRLIRCFTLVFPGLDERELPTASQASLALWDSVASVTLFAVVEEEFDVQLKPEDLEIFVAFELIEDFLRQNHGHS